MTEASDAFEEETARFSSLQGVVACEGVENFLIPLAVSPEQRTVSTIVPVPDPFPLWLWLRHQKFLVILFFLFSLV
jgi:hypothetical protein